MTKNNLEEIADKAKQHPEYPTTISYWCRIHKKHESAHFAGIMAERTKHELAIYNTPEGYTFAYETVKQLEEENIGYEWWKKYGLKEDLDEI